MHGILVVMPGPVVPKLLPFFFFFFIYIHIETFLCQNPSSHMNDLCMVCFISYDKVGIRGILISNSSSFFSIKVCFRMISMLNIYKTIYS